MIADTTAHTIIKPTGAQLWCCLLRWILHLGEAQQHNWQAKWQLTEDIACLNSLSLLKELFKKWSNLSFKSRRLWDKRKPKTVNYINEPLTSTLINDGHDGNETIKFYTKDISQMLSSPNIFSCTHCNYHHCFIFSVCQSY